MRSLLPLLLGLIGLAGGFVAGWAIVFVAYLSLHSTGPVGLAYDHAYAYATISGIALGVICSMVAVILGKHRFRG